MFSPGGRSAGLTQGRLCEWFDCMHQWIHEFFQSVPGTPRAIVLYSDCVGGKLPCLLGGLGIAWPFSTFVVFEPFVGEAFFGGWPPLAILATFAICHNFAHEPESQKSS